MDLVRPRPAKRQRDDTPAKALETSPATTTTSSSTSTTAARKSTYLLRREELAVLSSEARELEAQLNELRRLAGLPTREDVAEIDSVRARTQDIQEGLHANELYLGRVHSLLTNELLDPEVNPLSMFIHLPRDMAERRAILRSIQAVKLRRGVQVATQRLRHLDHTAPYLSEERFTNPGGEYHYIRQGIQQFPNFQTARQLYDTFVNFLYNMEISVTEGLGQMTLREDTEDFDPTIWNHRIVTVAEDVGCTEELNFVGFANFYEQSAETNSPMGIVVLDIANVDDLYPYLPQERTCKDVQCAFMVYELRPPGAPAPIVVFKEFYFIVQLPPQFELDEAVLQQLQLNCSRWPAYIIKYLQAFVVTE